MGQVALGKDRHGLLVETSTESDGHRWVGTAYVGNPPILREYDEFSHQETEDQERLAQIMDLVEDLTEGIGWVFQSALYRALAKDPKAPLKGRPYVRFEETLRILQGRGELSVEQKAPGTPKKVLYPMGGIIAEI